MYTDSKEQLYAMGIIFMLALCDLIILCRLGLPVLGFLATLAVSTPAVICYVWQRIVD